MTTAPASIHWRRAARILAMQGICQADVQGDAFVARLKSFIQDEPALPDGMLEQLSTRELRMVREYAESLLTRMWKHREDYDSEIAKAAENWVVARLHMVDRAILRLAVHEARRVDDVPTKVAIDEAIELAKLYGTAESPSFINGVLQAVLMPGKVPVTVKAPKANMEDASSTAHAGDESATASTPEASMETSADSSAQSSPETASEPATPTANETQTPSS